MNRSNPYRRFSGKRCEMSRSVGNKKYLAEQGGKNGSGWSRRSKGFERSVKKNQRDDNCLIDAWHRTAQCPSCGCALLFRYVWVCRGGLLYAVSHAPPGISGKGLVFPMSGKAVRELCSIVGLDALDPAGKCL